RGEAEALARLGLRRAVLSLTRPGRERFVGPAPVDDGGHPLAPYDAYGHDHVWWLDRMVRTSRPLVERMTLVWHDWFATSNDGVGSQRLMLNQNQTFRRYWLGSFEKLLMSITVDPAMLLWLNGNRNEKRAPNENYARELMELFTLGAKRGYTEADVREQARALTGFRNDYRRGTGPIDFRFDSSRHDERLKEIFGQVGHFGWRDACRLCVRHRLHPSFLVDKLWRSFVPTAPPPAARRALEQLYVRGRFQTRPVVEAILLHPELHEGPRLIKSPVVFTAGMLRATGRRIDTTAWAYLNGLAGQQLFHPPDVAGWDDERWLDTASFLARWQTAGAVLEPAALDPALPAPFDGPKLLERALGHWGRPTLSTATRRALLAFAERALADAGTSTSKRGRYPAMVENALRHLIAVSPDLQSA
ncbi:MAG: DUF1800 family protein, partial [Actinobacteria bacterium]|nr:DUF1800 family protein [Actinomycetota bacterium]